MRGIQNFLGGLRKIEGARLSGGLLQRGVSTGGNTEVAGRLIAWSRE